VPTTAERRRREERVKLFATAVSNVGVAAVASGFVAPLFTGRVQPAGLVAVIFGVALHLVAQRILHYVADDAREEANEWIGR
jgi:hypothetical protein